MTTLEAHMWREIAKQDVSGAHAEVKARGQRIEDYEYNGHGNCDAIGCLNSHDSLDIYCYYDAWMKFESVCVAVRWRSASEADPNLSFKEFYNQQSTSW